MAIAAAEKLMTIEEFAKLPDDGVLRELVRGRIVEMNVPTPRHGQICVAIVEALAPHLRKSNRGQLVSNDGGILTARNPDTLRGADVSFYSYDRMPKGPMPTGYLRVVPEVVFEVLSVSDKWPEILAKTAEYLSAGVEVVCVLDPRNQSLQIYRTEAPAEVLTADDEFRLPAFFGELAVPVRSFFE